MARVLPILDSARFSGSKRQSYFTKQRALFDAILAESGDKPITGSGTSSGLSNISPSYICSELSSSAEKSNMLLNFCR